MRKISRSVAFEKGLKRYFSGNACPQRHVDERLTSNGTCVACSKNRLKAWEAEKRRKAGKPPAVARRRYANKAERVVVSGKRYRSENAEKVKAANRKWIENNREKKRAQYHRYRARKMGAPGSHTGDDVKRLFFKQHGRCAGCTCKIHDRYDVDHKTPLSRGGSDWPRNLQLLCYSCNRSKGQKTMREWRQSLRRAA